MVESSNTEVVKALHMRFFVDNTSHIYVNVVTFMYEIQIYVIHEVWCDNTSHIYVIVHHCEILSENTCETSTVTCPECKINAKRGRLWQFFHLFPLMHAMVRCTLLPRSVSVVLHS